MASPWGMSAKEWKGLVLLSRALSKMGKHNRDLLLKMAQRMTRDVIREDKRGMT